MSIYLVRINLDFEFVTWQSRSYSLSSIIFYLDLIVETIGRATRAKCSSIWKDSSSTLALQRWVPPLFSLFCMTMQDANAGNNSQIFLGLFTCVELVRFVYTVRANLSGFKVFVLSVVGDALVDSETLVVTSLILRIYRHSLRRCS
jgi:membrane-associated HD superfamily phosphohydrolase